MLVLICLEMIRQGIGLAPVSVFSLIATATPPAPIPAVVAKLYSPPGPYHLVCWFHFCPGGNFTYNLSLLSGFFGCCGGNCGNVATKQLAHLADLRQIRFAQLKPFTRAPLCCEFLV